MRNPPPRNSALEALWEERDHLKIQMNLLEHNPRADMRKLQALRTELEQLERRISRHQARP